MDRNTPLGGVFEVARAIVYAQEQQLYELCRAVPPKVVEQTR